MRIRKKDKTNLVKVGLFTAALTFVLMIMIAGIGKETSLFDPKVDIKARVPNVSALKTGSYVELKGIRIGTVTGINIASEEDVEIVMTILQSELKWIKEDSRIAISTAGLVGDKFVEIYKGTKDSPAFNPEKDVLLSEETTDFKKIMNKGDSIAQLTERILNKLDNIMVQMGDGKEIVQTMKSLSRASTNLEVVSAELKDAHLAAMVKNVNMSMASMNKSTASLERILNRVEKGPGTINSLIYDEGLHDDLRALLGGAQRNKVVKYFIRESIKKSEEERKPKDD